MVKMNFFGVLMDLKSENVKLEKGKQNPDACGNFFAAIDDTLDFLRIASWHKKPKQKDTSELLQR